MCGRLENRLTPEDCSSLFNVTPLFDLPECDEVRPINCIPIVLPEHTGTPESRLGVRSNRKVAEL